MLTNAMCKFKNSDEKEPLLRRASLLRKYSLTTMRYSELVTIYPVLPSKCTNQRNRGCRRNYDIVVEIVVARGDGGWWGSVCRGCLQDEV